MVTGKTNGSSAPGKPVYINGSGILRADLIIHLTPAAIKPNLPLTALTFKNHREYS